MSSKSAGRTPRPVAEKKTRQRSVCLTEEDFHLVAKLTEELGCSQQEVFRRALHRLAREVKENSLPDTLRMSGDEPTLKAKAAAIEAYKGCGTVALAANRANVTVQTVQYWSREDPVFRQLAEEAQSLSIGMVKNKMFIDAMAGNTSAQFGILNAHDPHFGQIRGAMIQRIIEPLLDLVVENARRYLSVDELRRFATDVGRAGERVALTAAGGKR